LSHGVESVSPDMAATRTKPKPKKKAPARPPARAKRSLLSALSQGQGLPVLQPHQIDVAALALVTIGIFLGGVTYLGWAGGTLGHGTVTGIRLIVGQVAYLVPVALVLTGLFVLARDARPVARPLRAGAICLTAALLLALAAGTLGIGRGPEPQHGFWASHVLQARGGVLGAVEFYVARALISTLGADILAVFLLIAGAILLSGATFASFVLTTRRHAERALRRSEEARATRRPQTHAARTRAQTGTYTVRDSIPDEAPFEVPELEDPDEFTVTQVGESADAGHLAEFAGANSEGQDDGGPVEPEPEEPSEEDDEAGESPGAESPAPRNITPEDLTPQGRYRASVTDDPEFIWRAPSARILVRSSADAMKPDTAGQEQTARALLEALGHFGVDAKVVGKVTGPHITRYEMRLAPGIKVSKVANLKDDLAYALAATDIRILAPIPGKTAVGVEVPNARRKIVHLGDVFGEPPADWSPLTVWLGKDIAGRSIGADLAKMPHLLVAGTTGAGKSACVNAMLCSVLLRATPHEVRLVLVDPKQVELNHYDSIPHLLTPVITSPRMAANALQNLVREMEQRYGTMSLARTRNLPELNRVREGRGEPALPYILCVIDELADLMMVAPADVEDSIIRLAQKARAVGIHLVLATQSPRVDVITGMIKANVPSRIAFAVSSQTDSRVILDQNGAESLLGQGDMLFSPVGSSKLQRIQGAYIDEAQIEELTEAWRRQGEPEIDESLLEEVESDAEESGASGEDEFSPDEDPLLEEAIALVATMGTASTSMLQRRLRLGYTRAGRLIDMLERRGIISGYEGSKPRQVLIGEADVPRVLQHFAEGAAKPVVVRDPLPGPPAPAEPDAL
jgi:S-DNA-T family DNA segregation ATPase FtsK/SpoIIIE